MLRPLNHHQPEHQPEHQPAHQPEGCSHSNAMVLVIGG